MAKDAITHNDSGTKRVPTSDAEWDEWVPASALRNYVLGDPLLDWLDRHGESKGFERNEPDERTDFLDFIFRRVWSSNGRWSSIYGVSAWVRCERSALRVPSGAALGIWTGVRYLGRDG